MRQTNSKDWYIFEEPKKYAWSPLDLLPPTDTISMPNVTAQNQHNARDALQGVGGELNVPFWGTCGKNHQTTVGGGGIYSPLMGL